MKEFEQTSGKKNKTEGDHQNENEGQRGGKNEGYPPSRSVPHRGQSVPSLPQKRIKAGMTRPLKRTPHNASGGEAPSQRTSGHAGRGERHATRMKNRKGKQDELAEGCGHDAPLFEPLVIFKWTKDSSCSVEPWTQFRINLKTL